MSSPSDSDTSSQASHDATSGKPTLEVYEDLSQELEDFIYLWRLGCIDDALKLYKSRLQEHQYKHFPILVEFVDALLDQGQGKAIRSILSEDSVKHFNQPAQRAMLTLMRGIRTTVIRPTMRSGHFSSFIYLDIPIFVELSTIESLLIGVTEDKFDSATYHLHELGLWKRILDTRFTREDCRLLAPFYKRCCTALIGISRYWEAFRLIRILIPQMIPAGRLSCFKHFFETIKRESYNAVEEESNQPAKIAYLAGLIEYLECVDDMLDFLDEAVDDGVLKPLRCINEATLMLEHFFGTVGNAKSVLYRALSNHCNRDGYELMPDGPGMLLPDEGGWSIDLTESEKRSLRDLYPPEYELKRIEQSKDGDIDLQQTRQLPPARGRSDVEHQDVAPRRVRSWERRRPLPIRSPEEIVIERRPIRRETDESYASRSRSRTRMEKMHGW